MFPKLNQTDLLELTDKNIEFLRLNIRRLNII